MFFCMHFYLFFFFHSCSSTFNKVSFISSHFLVDMPCSLPIILHIIGSDKSLQSSMVLRILRFLFHIVLTKPNNTDTILFATVNCTFPYNRCAYYSFASCSRRRYQNVGLLKVIAVAVSSPSSLHILHRVKCMTFFSCLLFAPSHFHAEQQQ